MTLYEVKALLKADMLTNTEDDDSITVKSACGADLMSDVLAFSKDQGILLTGLINPQVIRTAEMMDIRAVVFVRGKLPSSDMIELANSKNMPLLTTRHRLYTACGLLYKNGLGGEDSEVQI